MFSLTSSASGCTQPTELMATRALPFRSWFNHLLSLFVQEGQQFNDVVPA